MDDLISRQAVVKAIDRHTFDTDNGLCLDDDITVILEQVPSAQPEAIIHCKDCTYFDTTWKPQHGEDNNYYCVINDGIWNINEHCSRAERRIKE